MTSRSVVVMGVSGCGKSTVGAALAEALAVDFVDADDLHSPRSKRTMASGTPLTEGDRAPWLRAVAARIRDDTSDGRTVVVACSGLRRSYRDTLRAESGAALVFVHLDGDTSLLAQRLRSREGHFMPPTLLDSQLATLERLEPDEPGIVVDSSLDVTTIVQLARAEIRH